MAWAIVWVVLRYGLDELVLSSFQHPGCSRVRASCHLGAQLVDAPHGQRLREALEQLGPIFVKFGQVLSTRRDLLPPDMANELACCKTGCRPSNPRCCHRHASSEAFRETGGSGFLSFERKPVASASIAQVHFRHAAATGMVQSVKWQ